MFAMPAAQNARFEHNRTSFDCNGVDERLADGHTAPDGFKFDRSSREVTMSCWFLLRSDNMPLAAGNSRLMYCNNGADNPPLGDSDSPAGYYFTINANQNPPSFVFIVYSRTATWNTRKRINYNAAAFDCSLDEWHQLTFTYSFDEKSDEDNTKTGRPRVYLDTRLLVPTTVNNNDDYVVHPDAKYTNRHDTTLMAQGAAQPLDGLFYSIAHWEKEFTQEEVNIIYNNGKPLDYIMNQGKYQLARWCSYYWKGDGDEGEAGSTTHPPMWTERSWGSERKLREIIIPNWSNTRVKLDLLRNASNVTPADDKVNASPWDDL